MFVNFSYKTQRFSVELGETERTYAMYWDKNDTVGETAAGKGSLPVETPPRSVLKMTYSGKHPMMEIEMYGHFGVAPDRSRNAVMLA